MHRSFPKPPRRLAEYYLAMAALDQYESFTTDHLPTSTSVVFRIHQLGHACEGLVTALTALEQTWRREYYDTVRADELAAVLQAFRSTSLGGS